MVNNAPDLMVTLIKMQAKTNEKLEQCNRRIKQLEHIIHMENISRTSPTS
ncbi:hypothetical protein ACTQ5K_00425 [Niallia sp. Sow4_A1]|nr:hypothetical protein [Bacillus sp. 522_BSPC]MCM3360983.1 hypothetical protein [Niallia sp. MER TA 168]CAI9385762.1 hypothetical protein BACSP_00153 [Bacillus sp. T2.9-1]